MAQRLKEIDALRGVAILTMIAFHVAVMLYFFDIKQMDLFGGPWYYLARFTQFLFLGLVGVSIALSRRGVWEQTQRGVKLFFAGLLVSVGTALVFKEDFVRFGILHFIGVAVILVSFFKGKPALAVIAAVVAILLHDWFESTDLYWVLWSPWDYFPPFPWLAVPLVGVAIGELWVKTGRLRTLAFLGELPLLPAMGRHSLVIYLLHFPLLYSMFWLISHT